MVDGAMNSGDSSLVRYSFQNAAYAAEQAAYAEEAAARARMAPHVIHGAHVNKVGEGFVCFLGEGLQGIYAPGDTPEKACAEFDRIWAEGNATPKVKP